MGKNPTTTEKIETYLTEEISRETDVQKALRQETAKLPQAIMQITYDQAAFLGFLVCSINAKKIIEIGTFTGYSALAMAMALPKDGKLIACDISKEWTDMAKRYWAKAGVSEKIDLRIGPAKESVAQLLEEGNGESFDMAFIDADKAGYDYYYEGCLRLLKPGGLIALDNMLWGGAVADSEDNDKQTVALRTLNAKIRDDSRVDCSLVPIADGVMLARKR